MPPRPAPRKNWCLTVYPDKEADPRTKWDDNEMQYLIVGNETCPETGRKHYQVYVQLKKKKRFDQVKQIFGPSVHIEASRGTDEQNFEYCSKEGDYTEFGRRNNTKGSRTDLAGAVEASMTMTLSQLMVSDEHSQVVARHMPYFRQLYANRSREDGLAAVRAAMSGVVLREWQQRLVDIVVEPPCPRKVYWLWDSAGNTGKSFMARYLMAWHDATIFTCGKVADLAYAYNLERVVVIDLARTSVDKMDHWYQFIESLKNGVLFSPKYESGTKLFPAPHVIVFANFVPDEDERVRKLSADRWMIVEI